MSWNARRFTKRNNQHHIPPRNPAATTPFRVWVNKRDHWAYNQLFQNSASFEQCVEILWRNWWKPYFKHIGEPDEHQQETAAVVERLQQASHSERHAH